MTPDIAVTVDMPTVNTELLSSSIVTVTLTSSGEFTGTVNLTASLVDSASQPITDWTVSFDNASVTVPSDGTATAKATVMIPSESLELAGTLQIEATDPSGTVAVKDVSSAFTAMNQITFVVTENGAQQCVYPNPGGNTNIKVGTTVRWLNMSTDIDPMIIHNSDNSGNTKIMHEADSGTPINQYYVQTAGGTGVDSWYCHTKNDAGNTLTVE